VLALLTVSALSFAFVSAILTSRAARHQARLERQGREQAQAMLLEAISIVDTYMRLIGEPHLPLSPVTAEMQQVAVGQTLDVYRDYIKNIQPADSLGPGDMRIVCRFLELQRYADSSELLAQCLSQLDRFLKTNQRAPADPELLVEALRVRRLYFAAMQSLEAWQTERVSEWLEYGNMFLEQAQGAVEPTRRAALLRACQATYVQAVSQLPATSPGPARLSNLQRIAKAAATALSELKELPPLRQNAPGNAQPENAAANWFAAADQDRNTQHRMDAEAILHRISSDVSTEAAAAERRVETTALLSLIGGKF